MNKKYLLTSIAILFALILYLSPQQEEAIAGSHSTQVGTGIINFGNFTFPPTPTPTPTPPSSGGGGGKNSAKPPVTITVTPVQPPEIQAPYFSKPIEEPEFEPPEIKLQLPPQPPERAYFYQIPYISYNLLWIFIILSAILIAILSALLIHKTKRKKK